MSEPTSKDPVIVVVQLSGGNDYMNTVVPHSNSLYRDYRPSVNISESDVIELTSDIGFHPAMAPLADMYKEGNVAVIHGVGYENSPRSHFRSMDIWHTCEPETLGTEGWLGRAIKQIDPNKENVVTAVSMGPSLYRALVAPDVPVATVENLDNYGLLTDISPEQKRDRVLDRYKKMYSPMIGSGPVMEFLGQTGLDAMKGADLLNVAPSMYSSTVEYADTSIAKKLKGIAQIHLANLGTRIFYCDLGNWRRPCAIVSGLSATNTDNGKSRHPQSFNGWRPFVSNARLFPGCKQADRCGQRELTVVRERGHHTARLVDQR